MKKFIIAIAIVVVGLASVLALDASGVKLIHSHHDLETINTEDGCIMVYEDGCSYDMHTEITVHVKGM